MNIRSGNTLTNAGASDGTGFDFKGNVTVNGSITVQSASTANYLQFSGSATQTVSGTGTMNIQNLRINNTSVFGIDLQRNLTVNNQLVMTDGHIQTGANILELGTSTSNLGTLAYTDGYVLGRMRRWFNGTNSGDASSKFPMGILAADYHDRAVTLEYTSAATTPGHLTVEFINSPMASTTAGLPILAANTGGASFDVEYVEDEGYWQIDNQTGTLTDGQYTINLTGEEFQTVTDVSNLTLLKRVGTGPWTCPGNHIAASGPTNKPVVSRTAVSGFSNFGFGSGPNNPLPIELLSFTATPQSDLVNLEWTTASEINNDFFAVERSSDAKNFKLISTKPGAGNSTVLRNYTEVDKTPLNGISYYRLKQTDFNGDFSYSQTVAVNFNSSVAGNIHWLNLNSETGNLHGALSGRFDDILHYSVYDMSGRIISNGSFNPSQGLFTIESGLTNQGIYLVRFTGDSGYSSIFKVSHQ
ncbi:MAG: T9SS type A sorting domain-containing protein [Bacteroidia bacterium]